MYLPVRVILHFLGGNNVEILGTFIPQALVSGVQLIRRGEETDDTGTVYVCPLSELAYHQGISHNTVFACIKDIETEEFCPPENSAVLLCNHGTLSNLFYFIQSVFHSLEQWEQTMTQCIINKDLQMLIECSGEVIGNSLMINDSNFALIAHAIDAINDDQRLVRFINVRSFAPETVREFIETDEISACRNQQSVEIKKSLKYSKYPLATYTIMVDEDYFLRVNMYFDKKGMSPGLLDLFEMLVEKIKTYVKCVPSIVVERRDQYSAFFLDLLNNKNQLLDPSSIRIRAQLCGLDPQSPVSVYIVMFNTWQASHFHFLFEKLRGTWPSAWMIPRENDIIIVTDKTEKELTDGGIYERLIPLLREYSAVCGFSTCYKGVIHLGAAYKQAELAIKFGTQIQNNRSALNFGLTDLTKFGEERLYSYEKYYQYYMFDNAFHANRVLFGNTESMQLLYKLWISDKSAKSNNLHLLHKYLINGAKATETAKSMFMHRNNVIYRISRIEELYNVDLSNPEQQFKLLQAYRLLDYYGEIFFTQRIHHDMG